jgi:hypothetical protein
MTGIRFLRAPTTERRSPRPRSPLAGGRAVVAAARSSCSWRWWPAPAADPRHRRRCPTRPDHHCRPGAPRSGSPSTTTAPSFASPPTARSPRSPTVRTGSRHDARPRSSRGHGANPVRPVAAGPPHHDERHRFVSTRGQRRRHQHPGGCRPRGLARPLPRRRVTEPGVGVSRYRRFVGRCRRGRDELRRLVRHTLAAARPGHRTHPDGRRSPDRGLPSHGRGPAISTDPRPAPQVGFSPWTP